MATRHKKLIESFTKSYINIFLIALLFILVISVIILSLVPPISRDALIHHLAIPKLYLKHGGIYEIPDRIFSYYPMNLDLLYLIPLFFGNDIIPKFIHFAFALMTTWLIYDYLKKKTDATYALMGALFFLSIPIIVKLSITVYVDLGLIFFSTAALLLLLKWAENQYKLRYLIASSVMCGLALGTKYNGLITLFLLTSLVPFVYFRYTHQNLRNQLKSLLFGILFLLIALIVFSPWMIRNYNWTKNPVYPLYDNWFQSINSKVPLSKSELIDRGPQKKLGHFAIRKLVYGEKWWETLLIPLRIFFQGKDDNSKYFDGKLNPLLLFLPFLGFLKGKNSSPNIRYENFFFAFFSVLFLLFAFLQTDMRIRWISPILPFLVILSTSGLYEINRSIINRFSTVFRKIGIIFVFLIVFFLIFMNATYVIGQFRYVDPIDYIRGKIKRDEYIERYRAEYPVIKYANRMLPENIKILSIFLGHRGYYSDREMLFNHNFFYKVVKNSNSPKMILFDLNEKRITHLLIRIDLFNKWVKNNFNENEERLIENFFQIHLRILFSKAGYQLYKLENNP